MEREWVGMEEIKFAEPSEEDEGGFGPPGIPASRAAREEKVIELVSPTIAENRSTASKVLPTRRMTTFTETYHSKERLKFLIENVLPESGLVFLGGISGTGKTILAIQLVVNLVMNRPTMTWPPVEDMPQIRALMLSLEMSTLEWQRRVLDMYPSLSDEEEKILSENFSLYSEPEPFKLWEDNHVAELIILIRSSGANVILLDSASVSFAEDLAKDAASVNKSLENLAMIRVRLNVCFVIVAHTRKPQSGMSTRPEDWSINDLFGHSGIAQWASSIFLLVEDEEIRKKTIQDGSGESTDKVVHIINVKTRFGASNGAFKAQLPSLKSTEGGTPLQFRRDAIPLQPMTPEMRVKLQRDARTGSGTQIAEGLAGFDFGTLLGDSDEL